MKKRLCILLLITAMLAVSAAHTVYAQDFSVVFPDSVCHPFVCVSDVNAVIAKTERTPGDYWYRRIKAAADAALDQPLIQYIDTDRNKALSKLRAEKGRIELLGMMYLLTADTNYSREGFKRIQALAAIGLPTAFEDHYLYIGELAYTYAIAYDWLYNSLNDEQKDVIASAVKAQCFDKAGDSVINGTEFSALTTNLNTVCIGGIATAAMAVCEVYPQISKAIIKGALENTPRAIQSWAPDGVYGEGPMYWDYGTVYLTYMMSTMDNLFSTDFGLSKIDGFEKAGEFPRFINGNSGLEFNFGDSTEMPCAGAQLYWFAAKTMQPSVLLPRWERRSGGSVYDLIWYDEALKNAALSTAVEDELKTGRVNIAAFRANDKNGIYAAIKGGDNQMPHNDLDIGNFVLDAMGERWAADLGAEPYTSNYFVMNKPDSPRWTYYAKRAEAHNVPLINPGYTADQNVNAKCSISEFQSDGSCGYALLDMTEAYPEARSVKRGIAVVENKSRVIIRDEIRLNKPGEIYWMFHTKVAARVADNGRTVYLTQNGKVMKMTLLTGGGVFETAEEKPLETSPAPKENLDRSEYTKIYIRLKDTLSCDISVLFTPLYFGHYEKKITTPCSVPLSEWGEIYGCSKEITADEGIKNRQTNVKGYIDILHFKNIDCEPESVTCYEDSRVIEAGVKISENGMCEVAFEKGTKPGRRYTIDFNGRCFSFSTAPLVTGSSIDDFIENKGPSGAAAFTNWLGFVVGADSGEVPNFTVISGDELKYGVKDTAIYMGAAVGEVKLIYQRENTKKIKVSGYTRLNGMPECRLNIYASEGVDDYNDMNRWRELDTVREISTYTVGDGYYIVTYTAESDVPVNDILIRMTRPDGAENQSVYLPQLRKVTLIAE